MIEGNDFLKIAKTYFDFLRTEFDFKIFEEKIRGNAFYDLQYKNNSKILSISYENIEDYLQIVVFLLENGKMPNYDDKTKTLHLNYLNSLVFPNVSDQDIDLNNQYFSVFDTGSILERKLLKSAKDLRLCLKFGNFLN